MLGLIVTHTHADKNVQFAYVFIETEIFYDEQDAEADI